MSRADVPKYSRVPGIFWPTTVSWPDEMKLASLYFSTCSHRTLEGIYALPAPYIAADLRWTAKKVDKAIVFLTQVEFLHFDSTTDTVLIRDALKVQAPENENQAKSCLRRIANLPNTELLSEFLVLAKQHCYRKGSSPYAQTFYQLLEQQLTQPLAQPLRTLNLKSSYLDLKPLPTTSNLQPRLNGDGDSECLSLQVESEDRKEAETRTKFPHLAQTAGFESVGQIRRTSKQKSMVDLL